MKYFFLTFAFICFFTIGYADDFTAGLMKAPVIDGKISAEEWRGAARYDTFSLFGRAALGKPPVTTTVWIGYDSTHLYIAFRCMTIKGFPLLISQKENDSQISRDDNVEVFLNGSPKNNIYLQLAQSAAGVRFDAEVKGGASQVNKNWSSPLWKNAASHNSDFYDAEFAIPLKMIPFDGSGYLRFNLTRTIRSGGNFYLTLAPMSGDGWQQPEKFVKLTFPALTKYSEVTAERLEKTPVLMGTNHFRCTLNNDTDQKQNAELKLYNSGKELIRKVALPPRGKSAISIPWECTDVAGDFFWKLCRNGEEIYVSATESYFIESGTFFIPAVSFAGKDIACLLKVNYGKDKLEDAKIKLTLKKDGQDFKTLDIEPFAEKIQLKELEPGEYDAEIFVRSKDGRLLFQDKTNFRVVRYFL